MIKFILLTLVTIFATGCVNRHGISLKYYSDCKEYYDMQGYYHKKCGDDDIVTYKEMRKSFDKLIEKKPKPKGNVW